MRSGPAALLLDLFSAVPHVMVCVKDAAGRYTGVNEAFVQRTSVASAAEVLGRSAVDLFPAELAASYDAQDRSLLLTGKAVRNQLEIITDRAGQPGWYLTSKVLTVAGDEAREVVAVSVAVRLPGRGTAAGDGLRAAVELAREEVSRPVTVGELARVARMSTDQLERVMRRVLDVSPKQYLVRTRAERAAELLATTERPIAEIAAHCGYYDQSQFTRQFKSIVGLPPGRYRAVARAG